MAKRANHKQRCCLVPKAGNGQGDMEFVAREDIGGQRESGRREDPICSNQTLLRQEPDPQGRTTRSAASSAFSSVQFSRSVMSNSLRPHESQHARPPCPSPTPGVHSDSCPSSQRCHPAISSSVVPFSSCPQSLSASESFPMSQLFA